jgi:AcrR family transcriptional regulator
MSTTRAHTTPDRLLHAALELFAAKGYHGATVHEICAVAEANTAAVNYHFGSKENLYRAVWEDCDARARRRFTEALPDDLSPEEELRAFIGFRVTEALQDTESAWFALLIHHEVSQPSPIAPEIRERFLLPRRLWFDGLVRTLLGDAVPERQARLAGFCIHGPLIHLREMRLHPALPMPPDGGPTTDPEALVETIHAFALGGLRQLRRHYEEVSP